MVKRISIKDFLLRIVLISMFVLLDGAAIADDSHQLAQSDKPPVEVNLCDTGRSDDPPKVGQKKCPDGRGIRRTLLIPNEIVRDSYTKGADGKNYGSWGIILGVLVTDEGVKLPSQTPHAKRAELQADTVILQPGWRGLYEFELGRAIELLQMTSPDDGRGRKPHYIWNYEGDPGFNVFELREADGQSRLSPKLLVPKTGEHIFFQCVGPVFYKGNLTNPVCGVRDFANSTNDGLRYNLKYSNLADWRKYSNWLWDYLDSITIKDGER